MVHQSILCCFKINFVAIELDKIIEQTFPSKQWRTFRTLIAVSGGPDSVALLRLITAHADAESKPNLIVAHVNHGTRGDQSDADAKFVQQLAEQHQLEFCLETLRPQNIDGSSDKSQSEETLRNARYDRLVEMAGRHGCRYLITGHHLDDQIETVLFRIFRGTGIAGLQGIPERRVVNDALTIVRPLLSVRSEELKAYLHSIGQDFRIDPTNAESSFTRNFLRNEILPSLEQRFGDVTGAVSRLSEHAKRSEDFLDKSVEPLFAAITLQTDDEVHLDQRQLVNQPDVLIQKLLLKIWSEQQWPLQAMSAQWWQRLKNAIKKQTQSQTLNVPGPVCFEVDNDRVRLTCDRNRKTNA